jgi:hypothetical protein
MFMGVYILIMKLVHVIARERATNPLVFEYIVVLVVAYGTVPGQQYQ